MKKKLLENEKSIFLEFVGDSPTTRLLQYLIEGKDFDYTLTDLMNAGLSWSTLNRIFPKFLDKKIITVTRTIGKIKLYKLNMQNPFVKKFAELYDFMILTRLDEKTKEKIIA